MDNGRVATLTDIIIHRISEQGPISFREYMEMCLYHPGLGYYTSAREKIGQGGDVYTSSSLTPAFGAMIGRQLEQMWEHLGRGAFTIVEFGAGTGTLCRDILDYLRRNEAMYRDLRYCIIEKSEAMRTREKRLLKDKVSWHESITEIGEVRGCVLSNEVLDNFPVHQVVMQDILHEVFVDYQYDRFIEILRPASDQLTSYFDELDICLEEGYRAEINLQATEWMEEVASAISAGYVITIDYGYSSAELYNHYRKRGTLLCYHSHHLSQDPYVHIGEQEMTAHVNFSALCHWGLHGGLRCCGLTNQAHFLMALGLGGYLDRIAATGNGPEAYVQQMFLQSVLIRDMGSKFKILIQSKGLPHCELTGLNEV